MAVRMNPEEVDRLAREIASRLHSSSPAEVRRALAQSLSVLEPTVLDAATLERVRLLNERMEELVWSKLPPEILENGISQAEQDEILGYGPAGHCV
jgi:antitoxin VapB